MTVIVLNNASSYLRGSLAQYLLEIRANVFVGNLNAKVRETLWQQILVECRKEGQNIKPEAILLYSTNTEQGFHMKMEGVPYRHVRNIDSQQLIAIPEDRYQYYTDKRDNPSEVIDIDDFLAGKDQS